MSKVLGRHGLHAQSLAPARHEHSFEGRVGLQNRKRYPPLEYFDKADIDHEPPRVFIGRAGIVGWMRGISRCGVGVGRAGHLGDARNARHLAARVVEQHPVAHHHRVAHEVASLIVAHAFPGCGAIALQVVDAVFVGFGLHQPVAHVHLSPSGSHRWDRRVVTPAHAVQSHIQPE